MQKGSHINSVMFLQSDILSHQLQFKFLSGLMSVLIDSSMFFVIKCKDGAIYHLLAFQSDL